MRNPCVPRGETDMETAHAAVQQTNALHARVRVASREGVAHQSPDVRTAPLALSGRLTSRRIRSLRASCYQKAEYLKVQDFLSLIDCLFGGG